MPGKRPEVMVRKSNSPAWTLAGVAMRLALRGRTRDARAGSLLATALGSLRGVYTKLGQELARRADLFPDEFREPLRALTDQAPPVPFERIRDEIERALGDLSTFARIEPEPLGTASIAQVHRARLTDGRHVAIKVRHPELTQQRVEADLRMLRRVAFLLRPWLRGLDSNSLLDEIGRALHDELDLRREAGIADEIRALLADDPRVVVPRVHREATAESVVTYDYVPRVRLDDAALLDERGVDPGRCVEIIADAYGRQVFGEGLFHADPHPGNLYLVDENDPDAPPGGPGPRIVFLDFGLAQRLAPELLEELRLGLLCLLKRDLEGLLAGLTRVGAIVPGREAAARAAAERALGAGAADALGKEASSIRGLQQLGKEIVRESRAFRVPRDLLLYARTLAYVYDLVERVSPGADPMPRLLPHLMRFMTRTQISSSGSGASGAGRSGG